jgi:4-amino-4-deoxy-L-arabinose transferase-like glycosyltransferase
MASPRTDKRSGDLAVLLALAAARLALHVALNGRYGFHRDELAVFTDARDLAWGYIAYPPLTPALGHLSQLLFGTSLDGFRFFAALAQCAAMVFAGLVARELGGARMAQLLAALAFAATPFSLLTASQMQYTAFDSLWWVLLAWMVARLINRDDPRWWLGIGLVIGLGMMTRYTMLFCVASLAVGVLATPVRRHLASPWLLGGVAVSLLVFLPNALWQFEHDFIALDFLQSIHARDVRIGRTDGFLLQQLYASTGPLLLPLWLGGLGWLIAAQDAARYRVFAWWYVAALLLFAVAGGRSYYLAPAYSMLLAAGAVACEHWLARLQPNPRRWSGVAVGIALAGALVVGAAVGLPWAPVNSMGWRISRAAHDNFAEQVGWPDYVAQVAAVYHALPAAERAHTGIYANNYGEAGAVDLYGPRHGLPRAISPVNSFWFRGYGTPPPTTVIVLGDDAHGMRDTPADCTLAARFRNPQHVENEETSHPDIYVCRRLRVPWSQLWPAKPSYG